MALGGGPGGGSPLLVSAADILAAAVEKRRQDQLAASAAWTADGEPPAAPTSSEPASSRSESADGGCDTQSVPPPNAVHLHVYDLDPTISKYMNKVMRPLGAGAFHAGVEVYGIEYCYGQTHDKSPGITVNRPRRHPAHIYRETIYMGETALAHEEFVALIEALKDEWPGEKYNILTRNCLNFADQLCLLLGVGCLPPWLLRLQQQASSLQESMQYAARRLQQIDETTGLSAVASAAATAAAAAARAFGGFLRPSLESQEGRSVSSRLDRALTSGISLLSGGLGAFADGVAVGLAGLMDDDDADVPYPDPSYVSTLHCSLPEASLQESPQPSTLPPSTSSPLSSSPARSLSASAAASGASAGERQVQSPDNNGKLFYLYDEADLSPSQLLEEENNNILPDHVVESSVYSLSLTPGAGDSGAA
ncbi:hypothetical protein NCLIV_015220 [Neospora caninum Liverpool]|uniref:PPPDE peptidase domain-containing protein 1 n=1 Tax=Neospora caninum (strain Liverpool) TaxID=572307 RepID=F0VCN9_NEOCL|nr:hypothetical protein NCLIV_015220 [Neospora caninum Liverpool]CBZ51728.1 hypothetical protein NCLIV_015220 [Neospora caninum Liverpool]CEL65684.1 TPA: PPPDE peptidase domain-containing protein 1 [Neospora caninum Liverpool]|eukprot:XP_003881761.1 hypothetical protein NCLIV_015220 [Neospora caninum Liverpool]